jgi:hypothetical protein
MNLFFIFVLTCSFLIFLYFALRTISGVWKCREVMRSDFITALIVDNSLKIFAFEKLVSREKF